MHLSTTRKQLVAAWAAMTGMALLAYIPAIRGGFVWDDDEYITGNAAVQSVHGLADIWLNPNATPQYYPMTFTSFWVEYRLWGPRPVGYHLVNVLLHAGGAVLLWRVLVGLGVPGAFLAAAVFCVHPVNVASVAWITERKNVLSGVLSLAALLLYLRFAGLDAHGSPAVHRRFLYAASVILFLVALLSKTAVCFLPAAILVLLWWKRERLGRRDVVPLVPLFVLAAVLALVTAYVEKYHVGTQGKDWAMPFVARCLIAGRAIWFYAAKLHWPVTLTAIYCRWLIDPRVWWQYIYPLSVVALIVALWALRRRTGKGPLAAILIFVLALAPGLGFVNVQFMIYSFVADHWQYHASTALIALDAALLVGLLAVPLRPRRRPNSHQSPPTVGVSARQLVPQGVLLIVLGILTARQAMVYRNHETLWRDTLAKNPSAWVAHYGLGVALSERGQIDEAIAHYRQAITLRPDYVDAMNNLGVALVERGRPAEAAVCYRKVLELVPGYAEAHHNLAIALEGEGNLDEAAVHYRAAIREKPDFSRPYVALGYMLQRQGKLDEAIACYRDAIHLGANDPGVWNSLGTCLASCGDMEEAIAALQTAVRLKPDYAVAMNNLAWQLATCSDDRLRNGAEAVRLAEEVCRASRFAVPETMDTLAAAYAEVGRYDDAVTMASRAARLAASSGNKPLQDELGTRITLYRNRRPFRQRTPERQPATTNPTCETR